LLLSTLARLDALGAKDADASTEESSS